MRPDLYCETYFADGRSRFYWQYRDSDSGFIGVRHQPPRTWAFTFQGRPPVGVNHYDIRTDICTAYPTSVP